MITITTIHYTIICTSFKDLNDDLSKRIEFRGCESDSTIQRKECERNPKKCVFCTGDGCNNQPAITKPTLSCILCAQESRCSWGYNKTDSKICKGDVFFPDVETCFTASDGDRTVTRGCTLDDNLSCTKGKACSLCNVNGCNRENVIKHYCYQCRSSLNNDCYGTEGGVPSHYANGICNSTVYSSTDKGCFTKLYESKYFIFPNI